MKKNKMKKLVYLFELDSVRNKDDQMEHAMRAVYREIVMNGNMVAISYNQLLDSRFFLSLLNDEKWSDCLMKLFRSGALRISQFGKYRTPSQYLIHSALDSKEEYIFSGLPIRSVQKSLIALVKRSLMYSDLTELNDYIKGVRTTEELKKLFREQHWTEIDGKIITSIHETDLDDEKMTNTLRDLNAALKLVLQIGDLQNAYNPPKDFNPVEEKLTMCDFIERAVQTKIDIPEWKQAVRVLSGAVQDSENPNRRSEIMKYIKKAEASESFQACAAAQAILDLCYNYACEASISNVSKHYDITEFTDPSSGNETFSADFKARFWLYYVESRNLKEHFLTKEQNDFHPYHFNRNWLCSLERAEHLVRYAGVYNESGDAGTSLLPYEYKLTFQQLTHRARILKGVIKKILVTLVYLLAAFFIENHVYAFLEQFLDSMFEARLAAYGQNWGILVVASLLAAAIVELLSSAISKALKDNQDYTVESIRKQRLHLEISTFGESLENIICQLGDLICAVCSLRVPYYNRENRHKLNILPREKTKLIAFVSESVAAYKQYRQNHNESMFLPSEQIPILDILKQGADVRLTGIEELTGKTFGITHQSAYHTMLVDPAVKAGESQDNDNSIYPYERLAATAGSGIVSIPVIYREGSPRFVLLSQYRHAIRSDQYGFPRGFGEKGLDPVHNTQKELWEEIRAVLRNPRTNEEIHYYDSPETPDDPSEACTELARITIDSGTLCDIVCVIKAELSNYNVSLGHEGIHGVLEVGEEELKQMILDGRINDSFTIGAFSLWMAHKQLGYNHDVPIC